MGGLPSYLLKCGECGGGMSLISQQRYGCSTSRNKGTCDNRLTIKREVIEERVLDALRTRLMDKDLTDEFCREYTAHMNRLRSEANAQITLNRAALEKVERDMEKMLKAVLEGLSVKYAQEQLEAMQLRKDALEKALDAKEEVPLFMHPSMAMRYAESIRTLLASLNDPDHRDEAAKSIRTLVDKIILTPNADRSALVADMKGDLAAILSLAGAKSAHANVRTLDQMNDVEQKEIERIETVISASEAPTNCGLASRQVSMVAGGCRDHFLACERKPSAGLRHCA